MSTLVQLLVNFYGTQMNISRFFCFHAITKYVFSLPEMLYVLRNVPVQSCFFTTEHAENTEINSACSACSVVKKILLRQLNLQLDSCLKSVENSNHRIDGNDAGITLQTRYLRLLHSYEATKFFLRELAFLSRLLNGVPDEFHLKIVFEFIARPCALFSNKLVLHFIECISLHHFFLYRFNIEA